MSDIFSTIPLASIRVFEAAARLASFTRAADELGMTQAAVSWQIKGLETRLGFPLFHRLPREVKLTDAGERLASAATEAVTLLRRAFADVTDADQGLLTITTVATLAMQWLAPRLGRFQVANPDLAVRLDTEPHYVDLTRAGIDLGLRTGQGQWPGLEAELLFPSVFTPLCSPAFAQRFNLNRPADALAVPRIGIASEWATWFRAAGVDPGPKPSAARLAADYQSLEVASALDDQGLVLASPILFAREIRQGHLVRLFPQTVSFYAGNFLVWPEGRRRVSKIARFRDWILNEVAEDPAIQAELAARTR